MSIGKFVLNVVVAFVAYGVLYTVGTMVFAEQYASMMQATKPEQAIMLPTLAYHLVQTIVVVWLFDKAVGSGDMKAGALFGAMIGLYLLASDSVWFVSLLDFPQDARIVQGILHLVIGAMIGILLAFMTGKGWGSKPLEATANEA
jgi:hypothetical protein